jgi:hypothetical protein
VKSLLDVRHEDSFLVSIMGGAQSEEIIVAEGREAVRHTPPLDKGHVGIVAAGIGARGNRAIGSTLDVRFDNIAARYPLPLLAGELSNLGMEFQPRNGIPK